jgi:hypothetical protein
VTDTQQRPPPNSPTLPDRDDYLELEGDEFRAAFGEPLDRTLDLATWQPGDDLAALYERLEREIAGAVEQEDRIRERIRAELFPYVFKRPGAPYSAGVYRADLPTIERVHRGLLFTGAVEACDGTSLIHDSLALTIAQIGVSLVSYRGDQGTWVQRLFRRDLRVAGLDPVGEAMALLEKRRMRAAQEDSSADRLSDLSRRGIMAYAERAILCRKSSAAWRVGHGNPVSTELLAGGGLIIDGRMPLLEESIAVWRELLAGHKKWLYVPSSPSNRVLLTLGNALYPLEYALVDSPLRSLLDFIEYNLPQSRAIYPRDEAMQFVEEVGPQIVIGVYRASAAAPPYMFYAHRDYAHEAALIALADSVLQEHRGFPMLIDLADSVCRTTFGLDTFSAAIREAYVEAGVPFRYLGEREMRP